MMYTGISLILYAP